jgi:hypothetical protein
MKRAWLTIDGAARVVVIGILYRFFSPKTVIAFCRTLAFLRYSRLEEFERAWLMRWTLSLSARLFIYPCLVQSTVLFWMERGSLIKIGFDQQRQAAHAWVERGGEIFSNVPVQDYEPLADIGDSDASR